VSDEIAVARLAKQMREGLADLVGTVVTPDLVAQRMMESLSGWLEEAGVEETPDIDVTFDPDNPSQMMIHIPITVMQLELTVDDASIDLPPGRYAFDEESGEFIPID